MAKPTDEYCIDRFFEVFASLTPEQQGGIITGLRAVMRAMRKAPAPPVAQLTLLEPPQPEPDSEGGEED